MTTKNITIGQNIRRIRKDFNLRQYEIAGEDVTRNLISLIENDKTPIYHNVANIISVNINRILYERGLDIYIQPEDLLNPERYDARKEANKYIEKLTKRLEEKNYEFQIEELNHIESFLNKWNFIDKKIKIYELLGDIFYNAKDSNREYYYYLKALEISYEHPFMKDRYKIILKLVYNCILTEKFDEAIRLCNFALSTQDNIPDKYKGVFYYNLALGYYNKHEYDRCLEELTKAKYYIEEENYRVFNSILMLEGICHSNIKNFDSALSSFTKLLDVIKANNAPEDICLAYINIIQIHIDTNNREKVLEFKDKVVDYIEKVDKNSFYLPKILNSIANVFHYLGEYEVAEKYLLEALLSSLDHKDTSLFPEIFWQLLKLYEETNSFHKINDIIADVMPIIYNFQINKEFAIILKLIYIYVKQDRPLDATYLIEKFLDKEV